MATLAGAKSYRQIHIFMKVHRERLCKLLDLRWTRVPAHTTLRDIFVGLDIEALDGVFRKHGRKLWSRPSNGPALLAIDGKTLRHSFDHLTDQRAAHIVSAFAG
ncbi:MAG: transposase family protein, partial [Pseudomonadota bacterium]